MGCWGVRVEELFQQFGRPVEKLLKQFGETVLTCHTWINPGVNEKTIIILIPSPTFNQPLRSQGTYQKLPKRKPFVVEFAFVSASIFGGLICPK